MSGAFTPGPWKWDCTPWDYDAEQEAPWLVTANKAEDRVLYGIVHCNEANAHLIAAAPSLLEALIDLLARAKAELVDPEDLSEISMAEAAIAKATGEAS